MPTLIGIDFETYWAKDYTLKSMSPRAYITDSRFEIIGVGIAVGKNSPIWLTDFSDMLLYFKSIDWSDAYVYGHNLFFDGGILTWRYGIRPALWLDTLAMARAMVRPFTGSVALGAVSAYLIDTLNATTHQIRKGRMALDAMGLRKHQFSASELKAYGAYCCDDVLLSQGVLKTLAPHFTFRELQKIDRILRMYLEPVFRLDGTILAQHLQAVIAEKQKLAADAGATDFEDFKKLVMSNEKFAALLGQFVEVPTKVSPTTGERTWALAKKDLEFSALQEHPDPAVQTLVAARLGLKSTIEETRARKLLDIANTHETLAVTLNYFGAHTGRLSGGGDLNPQNIPGGSLIRKALKAPRGRIIVAADAKQIEARVLAVWAGHTAKARLFAEGADVYAYTASQIYQKQITAETHPFERKVGKVADLQLGYGSGSGTFWHMCKVAGVDISPLEAEHITETWRAANRPIVKSWYDLYDTVKYVFLARKHREIEFKWIAIGYDKPRDAGYLLFPNGYHVWYPHPTIDKDRFEDTGFGYLVHKKAKAPEHKLLWHGEIMNNTIQGLAGVITNDHGMIISDYPAAPWKLQVHDELVFIPRIEHADRVATACHLVMSTPPAWAPDIPLAAEVKIGPSYGELTTWTPKT